MSIGESESKSPAESLHVMDTRCNACLSCMVATCKTQVNISLQDFWISIHKNKSRYSNAEGIYIKSKGLLTRYYVSLSRLPIFQTRNIVKGEHIKHERKLKKNKCEYRTGNDIHHCRRPRFHESDSQTPCLAIPRQRYHWCLSGKPPYPRTISTWSRTCAFQALSRICPMPLR